MQRRGDTSTTPIFALISAKKCHKLLTSEKPKGTQKKKVLNKLIIALQQYDYMTKLGTRAFGFGDIKVDIFVIILTW